jgi:hypothetical protein
LEYEGHEAYISTIAHGGGFDCESGCIYEYTSALTFDDGTVHPITNDRFLHFLETATRVLVEKFHVKLSPDRIRELTRRSLRRQNDHYMITLQFTSYFQGEVIIYEDGTVSEHLTLAPQIISADDAKHLPLQVLREHGYIDDKQGIEIRFRGAFESALPGWSFEVKGYRIHVYIDGTVVIYS